MLVDFVCCRPGAMKRHMPFMHARSICLHVTCIDCSDPDLDCMLGWMYQAAEFSLAAQPEG